MFHPVTAIVVFFLWNVLLGCTHTCRQAHHHMHTDTVSVHVMNDLRRQNYTFFVIYRNIFVNRCDDVQHRSQTICYFRTLICVRFRTSCLLWFLSSQGSRARKTAITLTSLKWNQTPWVSLSRMCVRRCWSAGGWLEYVDVEDEKRSGENTDRDEYMVSPE